MEAEKKLTGYPSIDKPWLKVFIKENLFALIGEYQNEKQESIC